MLSGTSPEYVFREHERRATIQKASTIYKMSMEEARYGAVFPDNEASIPMIQSKFPLFRSKSVNLSVKLPATSQASK